MAIDYSQSAFPKTRVKQLDRIDQKRERDRIDKAETAKAKKRAGGRCEVIQIYTSVATGEPVEVRCNRAGTEPHHLLSGNGVRNRGKSILAAWKLWACGTCHDRITRKILQTTTYKPDAAHAKYWRAH